MANELHTLKLGSTSYPISPKIANVTSTSSTTYYLMGASSIGSATATIYGNVAVYVKSGTTLYASGGFYESSDERLKNFSTPIDIDLDKISRLKKSYFVWKDDNEKKREIGVSAQEIQELYPEIVSTDETGMLSVAYDKLSVVALSAIDKLIEQNKKLEERISILEEQIKQL